MSPDFLTLAAPVIGAAFFASLVEAVEAFTIVLAIGTTRGWRPALAGAVAGLATLAALGASVVSVIFFLTYMRRKKNELTAHVPPGLRALQLRRDA